MMLARKSPISNLLHLHYYYYYFYFHQHYKAVASGHCGWEVVLIQEGKWEEEEEVEEVVVVVVVMIHAPVAMVVGTRAHDR